MTLLAHMTPVDFLSFMVCALVCLLCAMRLHAQTTLRCAPAHIGLAVIGFSAFVSCYSLAKNLHQASWPGLALQVGLFSCLIYLMLTPAQRARWDGVTERRKSAPRHAGVRLADRFGRIE